MLSLDVSCISWCIFHDEKSKKKYTHILVMDFIDVFWRYALGVKNWDPYNLRTNIFQYFLVYKTVDKMIIDGTDYHM